jgi:HEAT repeat protein
LLQDGILVRTGDEQYGFVLRTLHEYCLAGWIAHEAKFSESQDRFQQVIQGSGTDWGRPEWGDLQPLYHDNWEHVWPLVSGQLTENVDWLLGIWDVDFHQLSKADWPFVAAVLAEAEADSVVGKKLLTRFCESVMPPNRRWLGRRDRRAREWRIYDLTEIGGDLGIRTLLQALQGERDDPRPDPDEDYPVAFSCVWALATIGGSSAVRMFGDILADGATALGIRSECVTALGTMGLAATDTLCNALINPELEPELRSEVAQAIGDNGDERGVRELVNVVSDLNNVTAIRTACARALNHIGHPVGLPVLFEILRNGTNNVDDRVTCALAIRQSGTESARLTLDNILHDRRENHELRSGCAGALGTVRNETASTSLCETLIDPVENNAVRRSCAQALGRVGGEFAGHALRESLRNRDERPDIRQACAIALGELRYEVDVSLLESIALDTGEAVTIRDACLTALGKFGESTVRSFLHMPSVQATGWTFGLAFRKCLSAIPAEARLSICRDTLHNRGDAPTVRAICAELLGESGHVAADLLCASLLDGQEDALVRRESARAIGAVGRVKDFALLATILQDDSETSHLRNTCAYAMSNMDFRLAFDHLRECLLDKSIDPTVRISCADALCRPNQLDTRSDAREYYKWTLSNNYWDMCIDIVGDTSDVSSIRCTCAKVLAALGTDVVTDGHLTVLVDIVSDRRDDSAVRLSVTGVLDSFVTSDNKVVLSCLGNALIDHSNDTALRSGCAESLSQIGGKLAERFLQIALEQSKELLGPEDFEAYEEYADNLITDLIEFGGESAVISLCASLSNRDEDSAFRSVLVAPLASSWMQPHVEPHVRRLFRSIMTDRDDDPEIRAHCIKELSWGTNNELFSRLITLFCDTTENPIVRCACAISLVRFGGESQWQALHEVLRDKYEDDDVRRGCAEALGERGDDSDLSLLLNIAIDAAETVGVRCECFTALGKWEWDDGLGNIRTALLDKSGDLEIRKACARTVGKWPVAEADILRQILLDQDDVKELRHECFKSLHAMGIETQAQAFSDHLVDRQEVEYARQTAALMLGRIGKGGSTMALQSLRDVLRDNSERDNVRSSCLDALYEIGGDIAVESARETLMDSDDSPALRESCVWVLGAIGGKVAFESLRDTILNRTENDVIRAACFEALRYTNNSDDLFVPFGDVLLDRDGDPSIRIPCAKAIGWLLSTLVSHRPLETDSPIIRHATGWEFLCNAMLDQNNDAGVRCACADAFAMVGIKSACELLGNTLHDEDENSRLRRACAIALREFSSEQATQNLCETLLREKDDNELLSECLQSLQVIGTESAVLAISDTLQSLATDCSLSRECVSALQAIGNKPAAELLGELLGNNEVNHGTRRKCLQALSQIGGDETFTLFEHMANDLSEEVGLRDECRRYTDNCRERM